MANTAKVDISNLAYGCHSLENPFTWKSCLLPSFVKKVIKTPIVYSKKLHRGLASFRPPISAGPKTGDDESDGDAERSPIETQIAFEVVDENEAFWKLFPTKSAGVSQPFFSCYCCCCCCCCCSCYY